MNTGDSFIDSFAPDRILGIGGTAEAMPFYESR
jgi:hypothetical protein